MKIWRVQIWIHVKDAKTTVSTDSEVTLVVKLNPLGWLSKHSINSVLPHDLALKL